MSIIFFNFKKKKSPSKYILAFQRQKLFIVLALVVTWSLYTSLSCWPDVVVVVFCSSRFLFQKSFTQRQQREITSVFWENKRGVCSNERDLHFSSNIYILLSSFSNLVKRISRCSHFSRCSRLKLCLAFYT